MVRDSCSCARHGACQLGEVESRRWRSAVGFPGSKSNCMAREKPSHMGKCKCTWNMAGTVEVTAGTVAGACGAAGSVHVKGQNVM